MCGRYTLTSNPLALQQEFGLDVLPVLKPRYNLGPMQAAPIITDAAPRQLTLARWGLVPAWARDDQSAARTFNARSETVHQKATFKVSLARQRCLVPCDGFYEWRAEGGTRHPLHIHRASKRPLAMAGLWSTWRSLKGDELLTFTVLTAPANEFMSGIHERMPVFLDGAARALWLSGPVDDVTPLLQVLKPWEGDALAADEVSTRVNSVAHDDPECLAPPAQVQLSLL